MSAHTVMYCTPCVCAASRSMLVGSAGRDLRIPKCWGTDSPSETEQGVWEQITSRHTQLSLCLSLSLSVSLCLSLWTQNRAVRFHYGCFRTLSVTVLTSHKDTRLKALLVPLVAFFATKYKSVGLDKHTCDFLLFWEPSNKQDQNIKLLLKL